MPDYMITLSPGYPQTIAEDVIYALPALTVQLLSAAVCQLSPTTTTTQFVDVAATTTGVQTGAGFIRCTSATTQVIVKTF